MTKTEKMYKEYLTSLTEEVWVTLWDERDSTRIMIISPWDDEDTPNLKDTYFNVSYYDDATGDYWSPRHEYIWDIIEVLKDNKVDLTVDARRSPNLI